MSSLTCSRTVRYELRVLVGFKRAHRGWSKVYTAPAGLRPPFKNARNYNGFGASGSKSIEKPTVFLPYSVRRFKNARNYTGFGASGSKSKQKPMVFLPYSVPPVKNGGNYNGFGASASKSKQNPMVFLQLLVRRSPRRGITLVLAPARLEVNGIDVFPIGILTTKSFFWRGMVRSLKPLVF